MSRDLKGAVAALFCILALLSCASQPPMPLSLVDRAYDAMGGRALAEIRTTTVKGSFKQWEPEQSDVPGGDMRFANEATYEVAQDRSLRAARFDYEKKFSYPAPRTYKYSEIITPDAGYVIGVDTTARNAQSMQANPPAHAMSSLRLAASQRELRRGTVSALIAEMRNNPSKVLPAVEVTSDGRSFPAVSYDGFIVAFDSDTGLPARVRTLDYDGVWGDVNYDLVYGDWREVKGVKIPMSRKYELNGRVISDIRFTDVQINPQVDTARLEIPAAIRAGAARPAAANVPYQWVLRRQIIGTYLDSENTSYDTKTSKGLRLQELAPGVQHVVGGSHNSLLVEMSDHLIVFDAPVSDAQSKWVVDAAKAKYPGKPIRYLVMTHHHMDHSSGMRGYLAEGATLVVGQGAGAHYRKALASPMTRNPDMPAYDFSRVQIVEVTDRYVMSDGKREASAHLMDNPHAKGMLIGYVPDAQLGYVTDIWSPGRDPLPGQITPPLMAVVMAVRKTGINPARFAGGHGSSAEYPPLSKLAGQ